MDGQTKRRQRSRMACEPCRERKRKCGGGNPCDMCRGFSYNCYYRKVPRKRRAVGSATALPQHAPQASPREEPIVVQPEEQPSQDDTTVFVRSQESNSGSAFVRSFAMTVDPSTVPPFQTLAWNLFLGERQIRLQSSPQSITNLLSLENMQSLVDVYFTKVHPCYGFLDRDSVDQAVRERWSSGGEDTGLDAVLCGLAAVGYVFSPVDDLQTETSLVVLAKSLLDAAVSFEEPTVHIATAWILRTVYLRLVANPEEAWIASCTALHMIDATGLHCEPDPNTPFRKAAASVSPDTRRRTFGIARHLHTWLSFELARSRLSLQNSSLIPPTSRPGDYTVEMLELLPYTEALDPGKSLSGSELGTAFSEVLNRFHAEPPSVLAQCNLMLCLYRRLYNLRWKLTNETVGKAVSLIERGIWAVQMNMESGSPWHQLANVPFQSVCVLLAIDTVHSFSILAEATSCLDLVDQMYHTRATKDAVAAAHALIFMHQKRREADVKKQCDMLKCYPTQPTHEQSLGDFSLSQAFTVPWFTELIPDMDVGTLDELFAL